ncbi:MAG: hypothetical protein ACRDQ7_13175 [Haloechinothrix sp.]
MRLYEDGWSLGRIGEQLGVTVRTVQLRLRERGVETRDHSWPARDSAACADRVATQAGKALRMRPTPRARSG